MIEQMFIKEALTLPSNVIAYYVSQQITHAFPNKGIIQSDDFMFYLEDFALAEQCTVTPHESLYSQFVTFWDGTEKRTKRRIETGCLNVVWNDHTFIIFLLKWNDDCSQRTFHWIIADSQSVAETFFATVCQWNSEIRSEVLVFEDGVWHKSEELFQALKNATFDNLVLKGMLKQIIYEDLQQFFASREIYERYDIPWKRGILFIGPPGNGKTHAIKALVNRLRYPCLYVKSFKTNYGSDHHSVRMVFERARGTTPCILVLEDLDSLVDDGNRSFFLNELDGFAANQGIVTLATTNHPERLDTSILERPSRFDRKYHFELPGTTERYVYISLWNTSIQDDLRLSEHGLARVVELTNGFSFAYLKELFLSSMMNWVSDLQPGSMDQVMTKQISFLREQMSSSETIGFSGLRL